MTDTYRVLYEIDVEADSHVDAAKQVEAIIRSQDPDRFRPIFTVYKWEDPTGSPPPPFDNENAAGVVIDCHELRARR